MQRKSVAQILLTVALALVFGFFGIDKFLSPIVWIGWIPQWMEGFLSLHRDAWLRVIGLTELLLALLILIPVQKIRQIGVILICIHLIAILTQTGWNDIGVRDAGLLLSALALLFLL